jgi:hypothetical protein
VRIGSGEDCFGLSAPDAKDKDEEEEEEGEDEDKREDEASGTKPSSIARGDGNMANENCLRLGGGSAYIPPLLPRTISRGAIAVVLTTAAASDCTDTAAPDEATGTTTAGLSDTEISGGVGEVAAAAPTNADRAGPAPDS